MYKRQGLNGQIEPAMKAIWCSADRNKAFDEAMKGNAPKMAAPDSCKIDISQHYKLGVLFGIQGTPAMLTDTGMMIPGYQSPQELKQVLDNQKRGG